MLFGTKKTAWVITNHAPDQILGGYENIKGDVYAVDNGLKKVHELGLQPRFIIGDFDSVDNELLARYSSVPTLRLERMKNETDTELAIDLCLVQDDYDEIVICNDMQGRFDHALAIVQNLHQLHRKGYHARVENASQSIFFLRRYHQLLTRRGILLSLIAVNGAASFESSAGLAYPLDGLTLQSHQSRGISNVCISEEVEIRLSEGEVLVVMTYGA